MKVLHLFDEIRFSGAEAMYANAASFCRKNDVQIVAVSTGKNLGDYHNVFIDNGIQCLHLPAVYGFNLFRFFAFAKEILNILRRENIDAMHIHRADLFFPGFLAWFFGIPCVKTQHNTFKNRWFTLPYGRLRRWLARNLWKVQFHSIGRSVYLNELIYYKNPSIQINNWYDPNAFFPAKDAQEKFDLRKQLGVPDDAFVLVSVGACTYVKNHHDILYAISKIPQNNNFVYLHLGQGPTEQEEKDLAKSLGIESKVIFAGNRKNVRDYLVVSDVFVMPSKNEGLGNAALEAMACGIPVILFDTKGLRDLIPNADTGFLVRSDYNSLAEAIQICQEQPLIAKSKADRAMHLVKSEYFMEHSVSKIISLYYKKV